jgi:hypothetical protein
VALAFVTEPLILVAEFLRCHELSEAVIYRNLVVVVVHHLVDFLNLLRIYFLELLVPNEVLVKCPTLGGVKTNLKFKLQVGKLSLQRSSSLRLLD